MSDPKSRFAEFIKLCTKALGLPDPVINGDNYMFQVGERWVELKQSQRGDTINFLAVAYLAPEDIALRDDLVAKFNLHYLLNGGFSLVPDLENERLYLGKSYRLDVLDPREIRRELIAFVETTAMAGTWYMRSMDETDKPSAISTGEPQAIFLKL